MTLRKDTMDVWLEAALDFIRDSLRTNATVGIGSTEGTASVEVDEPLAGELARQPESATSIWIIPRKSTPTRQGAIINHTIHVELATYQLLPLNMADARADARGRFREFTSRVWNEALHLRDEGVTEGVWDDWDPAGDIEWARMGFDGRDLRGGVMRFRFTKDQIWMEGA